MLMCFRQAVNSAIQQINGNAKLLPNVTLVLAMETYYSQADMLVKVMMVHGAVIMVIAQ